MLSCLQLEEIERQLLEVPGLVDSFERRESEFSGKLVAWLAELETALEQNRLPDAGAIAAKRAMVLSAGRGVVPDGVVVQGRVTRRKLADAAAIHALRAATALVASLIEADRDRLRQAREMVSRLVALAVAKQLPGFGPRNGDFSDDDRWNSVWSDQDTQGGAIQLQGLVGHTDALILLNRGASGA